MISIKNVSDKYNARKLSKDDAEQILDLEIGNPQYFKFCPPFPSIMSVIDDMKALPPKKTYNDKYYFGFFYKDELIAVIDLILKYPDNDTAFIGFFMMKNSFQGKGIGTSIFNELEMFLKNNGFTFIRLGYMKGNEQSRHFWVKNGFLETGIETDNGQGLVVVLQKEI